jgi:carbonic anhydrase
MTTTGSGENMASDTCGCALPSGHAEASEPQDSGRALSRRRFLRATVAGTAAGGLAGLGAGLAAPRTALAQSTLSPDEALKELMDGNQRYISESGTAHEHDLQLLHEKAAEGQEPFAGILSCADARVPVELIFDQTIGHLFVCRVAGNITTPEIIASLEYGAAVLGTRVILVLAHGQCGAVKATISGGAVPGQISALYSAIRPAVDEAGPDLNATSKANAQYHAKLLREASPVIAGMLAENKIKVVAGFYDVATGKVTLLG